MSDKRATFYSRHPILLSVAISMIVSSASAAIVGGDSLPVRKPDAAHILGTIEKMGASISSAVMVGDSANDIDAAIAAGIPVIGVPFGYTSIPVSELGADLVVDHFDDLIPALIKLL